MAKNKTIVLIVIILLGGSVGFWLIYGRDNNPGLKLPSSPLPSSLVAGCGNGLCEEGETFSACPTDCHNPSSSAQEMAKLVLSPSDFPSPPSGTSWTKIYDQLLENEESRIWPTLQNQGVLAIHNVVIRLSAPGDISWDQWGHLEQFILAFPQNKIVRIFETATGSDLNELATKAGVSLQELPDPVIGEKSKAFRMTGQGSQYVIFFVKKNFLEYITFSGDKYEYQAILPIVRKAAEKIK